MNDAFDVTKNGPGLWTAILDDVKDYLSTYYGEADAIIAGGAVRDFLLDEAPKDIDVFISQPENFDPDGFGWDWGAAKNYETYDDGFHVFDYIHYSEDDLTCSFDVQFIFVPNAMEHLNTFDLSTSYVYYDGSKIYTFEPFDYTLDTAELLVINEGPKTNERMVRLLQKYPGLTVKEAAA